MVNMSHFQVVNKTEFDLPTVKLVRSLLYAECSLPASATLRTPLQVGKMKIVGWKRSH